MKDKRQRSFIWLWWCVLVLLVGVVVTWITSSSVPPLIRQRIGDSSLTLGACGGIIWLGWTTSLSDPPSSAFSVDSNDNQTTGWSTFIEGLRLPHYYEMHVPVGISKANAPGNLPPPTVKQPVLHFLYLPLFWPVLVLFGTLVALSVVSRKAERRMAEGHCPACGYDLRASVGACPECGAMNPKQASDPGAKAPAFTQVTGERGRV